MTVKVRLKLHFIYIHVAYIIRGGKQTKLTIHTAQKTATMKLIAECEGEMTG